MVNTFFFHRIKYKLIILKKRANGMKKIFVVWSSKIIQYNSIFFDKSFAKNHTNYFALFVISTIHFFNTLSPFKKITGCPQ